MPIFWVTHILNFDSCFLKVLFHLLRCPRWHNVILLSYKDVSSSIF
jgi:hypothetical protein